MPSVCPHLTTVNAINIETTSEESTISKTSLTTSNESYNSAQSKHSNTPTASSEPEQVPSTDGSPEPEQIPSTDEALTATRSPPFKTQRYNIRKRDQ